MASFALKGSIIHSPAPGGVEFHPDSWLVCEDGVCAGVFRELPERYTGLPREDWGSALIVPGYTDLHFHASQYRNLGLGMDMELLGWLDGLTYPEESRFAGAEYAREVYGALVSELRRGFTTRCAAFASAHTDSTLLLMELLEQSGLVSMVGRVSMDRNAPDALRERSADAALEDTEDWLARAAGRFSRTAPIITPRFVPSCTDALLDGLGALADVYGLPVQSHLGETPDEIAWVRELRPDCGSYAEVYERAGLLGPQSVMAHCIYLTDGEIQLMRDSGSFIAHCPTSNSNVRSGIAPARRYMDMGLSMGLGSDISGGHTLDMAEVVREALRVSKLLWRLSGGEHAPLRAGDAFYLATAGGGAFFGKCGAFLPGYGFDALVVDDSRFCGGAADLQDRFEKFIYLARAEDVRAKYAAGEKLF